jgi:hypothetical protein
MTETKGGNLQREAEIVGKLMVDRDIGLYVAFYDTQIEAAELALSPVYAKLRRAEDLRQELNAVKQDIHLPPDQTDYEVAYQADSGLFMVVQSPIPYESFLIDRHDQTREMAGRGSKLPGDIVVFPQIKFRSTHEGDRSEVEAEVIDFPNRSVASVLLPPGKAWSHYEEINVLKFNPEKQLIGFVDYQPQVDAV